MAGRGLLPREPPAPLAAKEMTAAARAVIVGGGVIGCALARELAGRGLSVILVERAEPGAEASGAAAGLLAPQAESAAPGPFFDLALESRGLYPHWVEELAEEARLDVGYHRPGILRCALPERQDRLDAFLWQREMGLAVEPMQRREIAVLAGGRVSQEVGRALFFPDEAAVDSRKLNRALALSARRRGVDLRIGTEARRFLLRGGVCRGIESDQGPIEGQFVIDAAGAWAGFDPALPFPVEPAKGQIVALEVPGESLPVVVQSDEVYLVPRQDGSLLAGATVEFVGFRKDVTAAAVRDLIASAVRLVPSLDSARLVNAWAGLRPATPDGLPILGFSGVPGLFLATGHFRNGILLAPVTARILADEITGTGSRDLGPFSIERFAGRREPAQESSGLR